MTNTDDLPTIQQDLLDSMKQSQELTLDAVKTVAGVVKPFTDLLPTLPFADRLPKPADTIDLGYAFAGELLEAQRDFSRQLVSVLAPSASAS